MVFSSPPFGCSQDLKSEKEEVEERLDQLRRELADKRESVEKLEATEKGVLEELMDLQERFEAGEARKAYTRALVALKADLPAVIAKDATVDFEGKGGRRTYYTHASLAGAFEEVTPHLTRHG